MTTGSSARRSRGAGALILLAGLLAACGPRVGGPAPVISGGMSPGSPTPPAEIVVRHGQTLSGIAATYHVPMQVLAEANRLAPPYRIAAGRTLVIPGAGAPGLPEAPAAAEVAAAPPSIPPPMSARVAARPTPPELGPQRPIPLDRPAAAARPAPGAVAPPFAGPPTARFAENPPPAEPPRHAPASPSASAEPDRNAPASPLASAQPGGNAPASPLASAEPGGNAPAHRLAPAGRPVPEPPVAAAEPPPAEPPPAPPPGAHGGEFLWPVRGRVLESYGAGPNGTRNDGINIAAPRGAAVEAADAGVVAYAGNELRGYGNLILVKHAKGWISAYAHCDLILVKAGQKVARGQVIARVGSSGNVSEPQLHFELRRGKHPVDPTDYLAPLPTAATRDAHPG